MRSKLILLLIFFFQIFAHLSAQVISNYPQDYFRSPIEGRIYLSGTFGELRSNHFHGGIDIKTGGVEGRNIYAAADGWVTRVKISPWGYGNALYIEHPNGYTTVYGHLKEIKGEVAKYIESQQYQKQSFGVDLYLKAGQFPVKKGDIIALSGNTGSSGGPHLHFEIRETSSQEIINPLLFGFEVKDFITPTIHSLRIYPGERSTSIAGQPKAKNFDLKGWGLNYQLKGQDTISILGDFYLGINTIDKQNDTQNKNGVYQIEVFADSILVYSHQVERLNFASTRYLNTLIDFDYYKRKQRRYQRTYQSPNNKLPLYQKVKNKGIFSFNDNEFHHIQYLIKDIHNNTSKLSFTVFSEPVIDSLYSSSANLYFPNTENIYEDENLKITIPNRSLYDTLTFHSRITDDTKSVNGKAYHIGRIGVGLQKHVHVNIKNPLVAEELKDKVFIGEYYKKNISSYSCEWEGNSLSFKTRDFGQYLILVDTIAPTIKLRTKLEKTPKPKTLSFIVKDSGSGISKYDAWLNGSWILLEYDPKNARMNCRLENKLQSENIFRIILTDAVGNSTEKMINF